jgi:DNA-binding transcriptional LysR family regulator
MAAIPKPHWSACSRKVPSVTPYKNSSAASKPKSLNVEGVVQKQPFILVTGGCNRQLRQHWETSSGRPLAPTFRIREDSVALGMVGQGMGVSILPRLAVEPLPNDVRASLLPTPLERVIGVVCTRRKLRQPALREFVAAIRSAIV